MAGERILVVDDEKTYLMMLESLLVRERYVIDTALNGIEALKQLDGNQYDLVLSDINMPHMDGIELLEEIRKSHSEQPVIIVTGFENTDAIIQAFRLGVINVIKKPYEIKEIVGTLRRFFQARDTSFQEKELETQFLTFENRTMVIPNDVEQITPITSYLCERIQRLDYFEESSILAIRLSLYEIIHNAIKHGNLEITYEEETELIANSIDPHSIILERLEETRFSERRVKIIMEVTKEDVAFSIEDEGNGFDHTKLPDATDPENLLLEHGRGLLLTKFYMTAVSFNEKGNKVTIIKNKDLNVQATSKS